MHAPLCTLPAIVCRTVRSALFTWRSKVSNGFCMILRSILFSLTNTHRHTHTDSCCCCVGNAYETATALGFISAPVFKARLRKLSSWSFHERALVSFRPMLASVSTNLLLAIWPLDSCLPPIVLKATNRSHSETNTWFISSFSLDRFASILWPFSCPYAQEGGTKNCMQIIWLS